MLYSDFASDQPAMPAWFSVPMLLASIGGTIAGIWLIASWWKERAR
jgi:hypothetical protein